MAGKRKMGAVAARLSQPKDQPRGHRPRRAALYCRVSTFDQNRGDYSSLEDQESRLRRAAEAEGYQIYAVYKEVASSASLERDQLKRMMADLEHFDAIFVTKLDRLSRSMHDWCILNERMDQHNVALVCTTQKIDTSTPMGRFFRDLLMLFAQFEREMIAERTYEKMAEQARRGRWGGGHQILGYNAVGKKLVVNEKEAAIVGAIFAKYLELGSLARTARWANLQGYRTKPMTYASGREVPARKFKRADVYRILTNVLYIGKVRFDDMQHPGEHAAIIGEKTFTEVQQLLTARKDQPRRGDQKQQDTLLLGILKCGFCGGAYTSSFVNKRRKAGGVQRYYYYKCTKKTKDEASACPAADLRADVIDAAFIDFFRQLAQEPRQLEAVLKAAKAISQEGHAPIEKERSRLLKELTNVEQQANVLVKRLSDPELAELGPVKARLTELDGRQRQLQGQIAELTLQLRQRREQVISPDEVIAAFRQFDELWKELDFAERQYAVRLLVKEVQVLVHKGEKEGQLNIEAWGRSPTPLDVQVADFRSRKLRNQDGWLPE
ncbi:MAG TPA: recombinase family protein [Gemmataceae bacterium]|nr:recombinase family protein [Gemmataceae bacterium]